MPDASKQLVVVPDREPLTELEARRLGTSANRLPRLRYLRREAADKIGSISVGGGYEAKSITVGSVELEAVLSLLIQRDEMLLASLGVTLDEQEIAIGI